MPDVVDTISIGCVEASSDQVVGGGSKRTFDLTMAIIALILLAPALCLIAALILCKEGRPVFYFHPRVGRSGKQFYCLKFRTMLPNAELLLEQYLNTNAAGRGEWCANQKLRQDPRVTSLGRLLRKTSLDELPQLFNIVRGEMSFVGPRPIVEQEVAKYGANIRDYGSARPGLTGLWQVTGRNDVSYATRVMLDSQYVQNWSFRTDLIIILKTVPAVLTSRGTY